MDDRVRCAAFLFYQNVKIAIAIILVKSMPPGTDVQEYVQNFQLRFRKKAKNCSLYLEKRIFRDRVLLLLPALKIFSLQSLDSCLSMETDDSFQLSSNSQSYVAPPSMQDVSINFSIGSCLKILERIRLIYYFLDALLVTESMCDDDRKITRTDVNFILSKIEGNFDQVTTITNQDIDDSNYFVSRDLLKYLCKCIQRDRVISTGISCVFKLLMDYFKNPNELIFCYEGFTTIRAATQVMLQSIQKFGLRDEICAELSQFIRESLRILFIERIHVLNNSICHNWYALFSPWKKCEITCIELAEALVIVLKEIMNMNDYHSANKSISMQYILLNLRRVLISYLQLHTRVFVAKTKPIMVNKFNLSQWERILNLLIVESMSDRVEIVRLAWACLRIIWTLKFKLKKNNLSGKHDF